jgi:hypothetical protein
MFIVLLTRAVRVAFSDGVRPIFSSRRFSFPDGYVFAPVHLSFVLLAVVSGEEMHVQSSRADATT